MMMMNIANVSFTLAICSIHPSFW